MTYGIKSIAQILESGVIDRITQAEAITMIGAAPISHASAQNTYGLATQLLYGHAKASSITPSAPSGSGSAGSTFSTFALADHIHPVQENITGTATFASRFAEPIRIGLIGAVNAEAIEFDGSESVFIRVTRLDPYALDMPVPVDKGGTGIGALTKNSILYAKETNECGQITPGTSGQLLTAGATGVPEFKTLTLPQPSETTPKDLGTAAKGAETAFARGDHVHTKPTYTASDVGAAPLDHTHTAEQITDMDLSDYLPLAGGVLAGPVSADVVENKSYYEGLGSYDDGAGAHTKFVIKTNWITGPTNKSTFPANVFSATVIVRGYRQDNPHKDILFYVGIQVDPNGSNAALITSTGWINKGAYKPSVVKCGVNTDNTEFQIYFEFPEDGTENVFMRYDIVANGLGAISGGNFTTNNLVTDWTTSVVDESNLSPTWVSGATALTELLHTPDTHTHTLASITDWPTDVVNGALIIGDGANTLDVLDPPPAAGTKWLKVVTALDPTDQTISWDAPAIADITGLTAALSGKSAIGHTHSYLPTSGGTVTGTITSTAETIIHKEGASGVVTFVSGDMVVNNKLSLLNIDYFRHTKVRCLRDAEGDVSQASGSPTQLGPSQHTAGTDSVLHLVIGGTAGITEDFFRYLNLPELGTGAIEGDKIEMIITNLSSTYKGKIKFNPDTTMVTFRTIDGAMLTQSDRVFASGERVAFHAIKTTSGGALCWRVVKTSETAF